MQRPRDDGFTLPELLVVLVVLPLIIGALAGLVITLLHNTVPKDPHGVATQLNDSHDAAETSVYFNRDVQGASYVSTSTSPMCAPSPASGSQLLGLEWTSGSSTIDISYYLDLAASPVDIVRYYCTSASAPSSYPVTSSSTSVIADNLFNVLTTVSVGTCPGSGFGSGATSCVLSGGNAYAAVTLTCTSSCPTITRNGESVVQVHPSSSGGSAVASVLLQARESNSAYQYSLTAVPRAGNAPASFTGLNCVGDGCPSPGKVDALIVNGGLSGGNCSVSVTGSAAIDGTSTGSLANGPGGSITASSGLFTADPSGVSNATSGSKGTLSPTPLFGTAPTDPYASQTEPPSDGSIPIVTVTQPNWDPSNTGSSPPVVNAAGNLNPATYPNGAIIVVTAGMTVNGTFNAPQGVLFYVTGGGVTIKGTSTNSLNLNPLNPNFESPTQPTPEIALWISKSDASASLTLSGNGNSATVNGAIYAPTSAATFNGGGHAGSLTATALDIGSIQSCNGSNYQINVG